jgi:hypothetical protein
MDDLAAFGQLLTALRPWLRHLVVVGGWAHRLHRLHPLAERLDYSPVRTRDADLAFSADEKLAGDMSTALAKLGFEEELRGEHQPPVTRYRLAGEQQGLFVEFLTPLFGSDEKAGRRDATLARAGITAQKLRYLEVLLVAPWQVRLGRDQNVPVEDVELFIPNPTAFIVQKILIYAERPPSKRSQDILYIHDTLQAFGGSLGELRRLWRSTVRPALHKRAATRVEATAREIFLRVTDLIREAARIPQDRALAPEDLRRACAFGLDEILGGD